MNKCIAVSVFLPLLVSISGMAHATGGPVLLDHANMITESGAVQEEISRIYQEYSTVVSIETLESIGEKDPERLTRDRFFELGLDREGVTVLNVFVLYARDEKKVRIAHAGNCGHDKDRIDDILGSLARGLEMENDDAFIDAVKSLGNQVRERLEGGFTCPARFETDNLKDMELYTDKTAFLVSDEDWRDVLGLVPVATWSRGGEACQDIYAPGQGINSHKCSYPLLIYHREGDKFDSDSIMLFLRQYGAGRVLVAGTPPQDLVNLLGAAVGGDNARIRPGDYSSFWRSYRQAVVAEDDYKTAMLASVYASYLNAPLFIMDRDFSTDAVTGKELVCVGAVAGLECSSRFSLEELQREYIRLTASEKVILVNPSDIGDGYCEHEEFNNVRNIYCRDSMAAGLLAAAKDEVIIFSPGRGLNELGPWFRETINSTEGLFKDYRGVKYLTIIAGHKAIDTGSAREGGYSLGRQLLNFEGGPEEEMPFGRIMGITIADTSSYIMRSVFYERLYYALYGDGMPGVTAIGHSFDVGQGFLPSFVKSIEGVYNAECYVQEEEYMGGVCNKGTSPPGAAYGHKNIILFMGRGGAEGWEYTLDYSRIPELDLSVGIAQASLTNSYASAGDKQKLFSANFIRKGGIGYYGAVSQASVSVASEGSVLGYIAVHYLIESGRSLGRAMEHVIGNMKRDENKKAYILLGDPSLNPRLPQMDIGYYTAPEEAL